MNIYSGLLNSLTATLTFNKNLTFRTEASIVVSSNLIRTRLTSGALPTRPVLASNQQRRFALPTDESLCAVAFERPDQIVTSPTVSTRIAQTFVDVGLAIISLVTGQTFAFVFVDQIDARGVVLALIVFAFVYVDRTIVACVAGLTVTFVRFRTVDAYSFVQTVGGVAQDAAVVNVRVRGQFEEFLEVGFVRVYFRCLEVRE